MIEIGLQRGVYSLRDWTEAVSNRWIVVTVYFVSLFGLGEGVFVGGRR